MGMDFFFVKNKKSSSFESLAGHTWVFYDPRSLRSYMTRSHYDHVRGTEVILFNMTYGSPV